MLKMIAREVARWMGYAVIVFVVSCALSAGLYLGWELTEWLWLRVST